MTLVLLIKLLMVIPGVHAADERPATVEQLKQTIRVLRNVIGRVEKLEKSNPALAEAPSEIDLSKIENDPGGPPIATGGKSTMHRGSGVAPSFKVYFDLNATLRPSREGAFSFENYHALLFMELLPNADLQFVFDVSPTPRFYELDYQLTPKVQLRAGRIWIPFDDMSPHNIFGGRVNVSTLAPGSNTFLPDIWTDLGVGTKVDFMDSEALKLVGHAYVVNGFQDGGTDPRASGNDYPNFSSSSAANDNNRDKAIGARAHALFGGVIGLGASYYMARWNDQSRTEAKRATVIGVDTQIRFPTGTEIRSGLASMTVKIPEDSAGYSRFKRGGVYGEFGQKLGTEQRWKFLTRVGKLQLDDRVIDESDQTIVGATLLYKPSVVEFSIHHSRDLQHRVGSPNYNYSALRMIIAL